MTIDERINKIADNIADLGEGIESAIWGKKDYNLEVNLEETFQGKDKKKIKDIGRYLGAFIVTKNGYLRRGFDSRLEKKYAQIIGPNPALPPFLFYGNNRIPRPVINTLLGLRLAEFSHSKKSKIAYAGAFA